MRVSSKHLQRQAGKQAGKQAGSISAALT